MWRGPMHIYHLCHGWRVGRGGGGGGGGERGGGGGEGKVQGMGRVLRARMTIVIKK